MKRACKIVMQRKDLDATEEDTEEAEEVKQEKSSAFG